MKHCGVSDNRAEVHSPVHTYPTKVRLVSRHVTQREQIGYNVFVSVTKGLGLHQLGKFLAKVSCAWDNEARRMNARLDRRET